MSNQHLKKTFCINSELKSLNEVHEFLQDLFKDHNLSKSLFNRLYLCVSEAVINAMEHGNKMNIGKVVKIIIEVNDDETLVCIEDEGKGFEFDQIPDPIHELNRKKVQGRGIHIIKNYARDICFKKEGSIIEFKFDLSEAGSVLS